MQMSGNRSWSIRARGVSLSLSAKLSVRYEWGRRHFIAKV